MKFETTPAFDKDVRRLKREQIQQFLDVVKARFIAVCDAYAADSTTPWPQSLRVKSIQGAPGILEMTWSLASPDGRVTFELVTVDGDLRLRWRRFGDRDAFRRR
ncbi:MAG: hypothetical protein L0H96_01995 [Humibacillus sp.]|nr:hypothetical protein [Humibacillus sp.]MDN5775666.1 hypothetical protein [Humibacillus sp.]